ncbi:MAG TPA: hypothetical protein VFC56_15290 [Stellaceae bacterium]|nr:hypothetical protein [Stellaceae bacterium]
MSDLDDALALLERAVSRLEALPLRGARELAAEVAAERADDDQRLASTAAEIVARVDAALEKIGRVLEGDG